MHIDLKQHFDQALQIYTSNDYVADLMDARKQYFSLIGQAIEEDEDYEPTMNSFNDWYLLQYIAKKSIRTWIKDYLLNNGVDDEIIDTFNDYNHSLFECLGNTMSGCHQFYDILHDKKITLDKEHPPLALIKRDIFIGRILNYKNQSYMLPGMSVLPKEAKKILKHEVVRIIGMKNHIKEIKFLFQVEGFKNKYKRYRHLDVSKIFRF